METEILSPPPKTGRDEKREAILKIAYDAFLADGYAATSMSCIAARVGGSKATLYNYFASKEDLFAAVIGEKCRDVHALLFAAKLDTSDFRPALTSFAERFVRLVLSDDKIAIYRLVTAETARFPELGQVFYRTGPENSRRELADIFSRAIAEGKLRPGNPRIMAIQFFDLCHGDFQRRRLWNVTLEYTPAEIHEHAAQAVAVFWAAYGPLQDN